MLAYFYPHEFTHMNPKYILGSLVSIPLLPLLYWQGKNIRKKVPVLPEATGTTGQAYQDFNRTLKVICLGESTIAGVGVATHEEGFAGSFAQELSQQLSVNVTWKVVAQSGITARGVAQKLVPKISSEQADLIVVGLGGNDAFKLNSPMRWRKDILLLLENLRADFPEVPITFLNMPPITEFPAFTKSIKFTIGGLGQILGEELAALLPQHKVYFNDDKITFDNWKKKLPAGKRVADFFSDGVHPSKLTYQIWAKDFAQYIATSTEIRNDLQL